MLRIVFLLAILFGSALYTYGAFVELAFLSAAGRLGPGFFPRIIGLSLIFCCLFALWHDIKRRHSGDHAESPFWPIVGVMAALSATLVVLFSVLGGPLAMVVFLLIALSILNRGRHLQNIAISAILPIGIYFLFDVWLNSSMPQGMLPLPI